MEMYCGANTIIIMYIEMEFIVRMCNTVGLYLIFLYLELISWVTIVGQPYGVIWKKFLSINHIIACESD